MSTEADILLQGRGVHQNAGQGSAWVQDMGVYQRKVELRTVDSVTTIYKGWAAYGSATADATWLIQRIILDDSQGLDVQDQSAGLDFTQVWDSRASLTYT